MSLSFQHQLGTLSLPPRQLFAVPQHVDVGLDLAVLQVYLDAAHERLGTATSRLPLLRFPVVLP